MSRFYLIFQLWSCYKLYNTISMFKGIFRRDGWILPWIRQQLWITCVVCLCAKLFKCLVGYHNTLVGPLMFSEYPIYFKACCKVKLVSLKESVAASVVPEFFLVYNVFLQKMSVEFLEFSNRIKFCFLHHHLTTMFSGDIQSHSMHSTLQQLSFHRGAESIIFSDWSIILMPPRLFCSLQTWWPCLKPLLL